MSSSKPAAIEPRRRSRLLRALGWLALMLAALAALVIVAMLASKTGPAETLTALGSATRRIRPWSYAVHLALIGLAWWRFDLVAAFALRRGWVSAARLPVFLASRHKLMAMVLAVELVVVIGLPLRNPFSP